MLGDSAAEVDGRQRGEDERLKRGDEAHFEDEQDTPSGRDTQPTASSPRITARPPDMKRMIRWPARMFAKRRTLSEISRMKFDMNSRMKMNTAIPPVTPDGT